MRSLILLSLVTVALCQILPFGDRIHGYSFQYHRRDDLVLIRNSTTCFYVEVDKSVEDKLNNKDSREKFEDELYQQIKADTGETVAKLQDFRDKYHDNFAVFECARHKVYKLTYTST